MELEKLYEQLNLLAMDDFEQIEAAFFQKLQSVPDKIKPQSIVAFLNISNWQGISVRSGVWTFYESANPKDLVTTSEYLVQKGQIELAAIFNSGIHDYQNPQYAQNYDYPNEWMEESDLIDSWIMVHIKQLNEWKRELLLENRNIIINLAFGE